MAFCFAFCFAFFLELRSIFRICMCDDCKIRLDWRFLWHVVFWRGYIVGLDGALAAYCWSVLMFDV